MLVALAGPALAQDRREYAGITMNGVPHPASAAITYFDSLGLTEAQVRALRRATTRAEEALSARYQKLIGDTAVLFQYWRPGPVDSAAVLREALTTIEADAHVQLELFRLRDETFRVLTPAQRRQLGRIIRRRIYEPAAIPRTPCTGGGIGGGVRLLDRATAIYSATFRGDSAQIHMVVVGRPDHSLEDLMSPTQKPAGMPQFGGGGTMGRWWVLYEAKRDVAWIDTTSIAINGKNVVLLQGIDRATRPPDVVGQVAGPVMVRTGACVDSEFSDILRVQLLAVPAIRAFLDAKR